MIRNAYAGKLRKENAGQEVTLAGWVARRRDHGGVAFIDLRDISGSVQVVINDEKTSSKIYDILLTRIFASVQANVDIHGLFLS